MGDEVGQSFLKMLLSSHRAMLMSMTMGRRDMFELRQFCQMSSMAVSMDFLLIPYRGQVVCLKKVVKGLIEQGFKLLITRGLIICQDIPLPPRHLDDKVSNWVRGGIVRIPQCIWSGLGCKCCLIQRLVYGWIVLMVVRSHGWRGRVVHAWICQCCEYVTICCFLY